MIIRNGTVFTEDGNFEKRDVIIKDKKIANILAHSFDVNEELEDSQIIDAQDMYVIPGLIDIHLHGALGCDVCDADVNSLEKIAQYELSNGIMAFLPTSMSYDEERLSQIFETVDKYAVKTYQTPKSKVLGINMEGPFISTERKGAQNPLFIKKPDINMFMRLYERSGKRIRIVDIAPETDANCEFIEKISNICHISIAHTNADYDTAMKAFDAGADHLTHMYNAMPPFGHRSPGVIGATMDSPKVYAEIIADGQHVDKAAVRAAFKLMGEDRIVFISDSMEATGMPDGEYELGGQKVITHQKKATLLDNTLAGSITNLMDCVRIAVREMGIPLETALRCATINPAKSIGEYERRGSISEGKVADLIVLDKNLIIQYIIQDGHDITHLC